MLSRSAVKTVGIEFDRTSIHKTSKHSLCHNSLCTNPSKTALYFEKHYILASLVKGEVLSPERIRATTGGIVTPTFCAAPPFQKPHYPSKIANTLASLVKGRWLDGKAQTVVLLRFNCNTPAFFIHQTFLPSRRRDCLSCIDPLHPHNPRKRTIVPCSALNSHLLSKVRCRRPKKFGRLPEGLPHQPFAPH